MSAPVKREVSVKKEVSEGDKEDETEPRIIRLSNDEYFFPTSSSRRESAATSSASINATEGSPPSSPESTTGERPVIPFTSLSSSDYMDEDVRHYEDGEERLISFKDQSITRPIAQRIRHPEPESEDEYEETLIYIDLDDIPNVDELFAVEPDDFLSFQTKRQRELPKPKKATSTEIKLKIHNMDSDQPVLQIGNRYYVGKYEEPVGSSLFFQPKEPVGKPLPPHRLKSIVPEECPRRDKLFHEKLCSDKFSEYELVGNVDKILKMTRREARKGSVDLQQMPVTPGGLPPLMPQKTWPGGYTPSEVFSGKYHTDKNLPSGPFSSLSSAEEATASSENQHQPNVPPQNEASRESPTPQDSILGLESH